MKKLFLLALVAFVAGAAFAETAPTFSGTFSTYWAYQLQNADPGSGGWDKVHKDDYSIGMEIDLGATIDEWNTVSVKAKLADAVYWDDKNDNKTIEADAKGQAAGTALAGADELDNRGNYLRLDNFKLVTDVTGALGLDSPVGVKTHIGDISLGTANVANVAPLSVDVVGGTGTDGGVAIGVELGIFDTVRLTTIVTPKNVAELKGQKHMVPETGLVVQANGLLDGMIDAAAFFIASEWDFADDTLGELKDDGSTPKDVKDDEGINAGLSVAVSPVAGLKLGLGYAANLTYKEAHGDDAGNPTMASSIQFDVAYALDKLGLGASYGLGNYTAAVSDADDDNAFVKLNLWRLSLSYDVLDNLAVYGGVGGDFHMKDANDEFDLTKIKYDVGLTTALKALAIQVGLSNDLDWKAPEDDFNDALFVKVSTSF